MGHSRNHSEETQLNYTNTQCGCDTNLGHQNRRLVNELLDLSLVNRLLLNKLLEKDSKLEQATSTITQTATTRNEELETINNAYRRTLLNISNMQPTDSFANINPAPQPPREKE